jgi:type IV pilus assembly protein PilO
MATKSAKKENAFDALPTIGKVGILGLILGVLTIAYYMTLHRGVAEEITAAEAQHVQLEQQHAQGEQRQREYLVLVEELAVRERFDRQNKRILPENAEIASFLQDLDRLAELSGLQMELVEPRPEEASEFYVRLPVALRLRGRYHQIAKFFYNVSRLDRAINMENVRLLDPTPGEGGAMDLRVEVLATTFKRPVEQVAPAAAGAARAPGGAS